MLEEEPQSFHSLNNSEISFPIRQLCEHWQPCPSSSLEINLFPAVLAFLGKSDSSAFTNGRSHQQNVNYKAKQYTTLKGKNNSPGNATFFFSFLSTLFFPQSVAGQEHYPLGKHSARWWGIEEMCRLCHQTDPRPNSKSKNVEFLWDFVSLSVK